MTIKSPTKWHKFDWALGYRVSNTGVVQTNWGFRGSGYARKPVWYNRLTWQTLKVDLSSRGRPRVTLRIDGVSKRFFVAHLVLLAFVGPRPDGMEACHYPDSNPQNCNVENLRWDSHQANIDDKAKMGTNTKGADVNTAKLSEQDVLDIRAKGYPLKQHADRYGVSSALVSLIIRRKVWKHVQDRRR